jgi:hypothetical protein
MYKCNTSNMEIVVASCRAYSDAWEPFQALFRKFWKDCPYHVTLVTDFADERWRGRFLQAGTDLGWSRNLIHGLSLVQSEHVLLMMEDFFLNDKVDNQIIWQALKTFQTDGKVQCIRLMPCPGPDGEDYNEYFGRITIGAPYRVSCQTAIWRKSSLERLLRLTNDAWSFEIDGTNMRTEGDFLSVYRKQPFPFSYYNSAINRGKWNPGALEFCRNNGVSVDTSRRPVEGSPSV